MAYRRISRCSWLSWIRASPEGGALRFKKDAAIQTCAVILAANLESIWDDRRIRAYVEIDHGKPAVGYPHAHKIMSAAIESKRHIGDADVYSRVH
jgi:hypothetical protein